MGTARQDFERFVQWLHEPSRGVPATTLQFANMVLANFEAVAETARQHNARSHLLANIAREQLARTGVNAPIFTQPPPQVDWPWVQLRRLTLGPFRGFRERQEFDLSERVVLCYGPNGSGKSSLCEALEFALCGSVEEAAQKRLDERDYLANIHVGRFEPPVLTAMSSDGREVHVRPDEDTFRFLFIEKNRIDSFSRIAASPPNRKSNLIATLFGLDRFNDFASHFNESMDAALTLETRLQDQLTERRLALRSDEAIAAGETESLARLDQAATEYVAGLGAGVDYSAFRAFIGTEEAPGRLQELNLKLRTIPPALTGVSRERIAELFVDVDAGANRLAAAEQLLDERRRQISFRDLFAAVQVLRSADPHHCPACLTPIESAVEDPFERAEAGLRELTELAALESDYLDVMKAQENLRRTLNAELRKLKEFLEASGHQDSPVLAYLCVLPDDSATQAWWRSLQSPAMDRERVLEAADRAALQDAYAREQLVARNAEALELNRLNDARVWIAGHEERRARVIQDAAQARDRTARWQNANTDLIRSAEREVEGNLRDRPIKEAYDSFYALLEAFREGLPGMLMADLNVTTMELYNEFNNSDRQEDKLSELRLPLTGEDIIEVAFRGNPGRRVNALAALSEGHIRCLGLAILLAKAHSVRTPVIIFDDAINAIDHDHRGGIRAALFESDRFRQTQIIVTCHSPEWVKDIANHLPRGPRSECQQYVLLHHDGDYQPRVRPDVGNASYLEKARLAVGRFDPRDALSFARKALELLAGKTWKWLESHRVGDIAVKIEGPGKEPQLRNLCEALHSKMTKTPTFAHPSKQPLIDHLGQILGIPEQTLIWTLLNKGTHEEPDRDDFDLQHVDTVLRVLDGIDGLDLRPGR